MPELPEVEDAARRLALVVTGGTIANVIVRHRALAHALPAAARARLRGRTIARVERRGKHQLLWLDDGSALDVHFRMSGDWSMEPAASTHRWARAVVQLENGTSVALIDPRALATVRVHPPGVEIHPTLGPDPFDPCLDARALGRALARRRGAIKPALLDQHVLAGVGNIYAAEALWLARLSPRAPAAALGPRRRARLLAAIRQALRHAPAGRYTSGPARAPRWRVYDREDAPCRRCRTPIRRIVQGGRSTYYCPRCQRA